MYTDTGTVGVTKEAKFVSMTSGGFTLNFAAANNNASQVYSLALAGHKTSKAFIKTCRLSTPRRTWRASALVGSR